MERYTHLRNLLKNDPIQSRWSGLYNYFIQIIGDQMEQETIIGHTLFSQISYLSKKNKWPNNLRNTTHYIRKINPGFNNDNLPTKEDIRNCQYVITALIQIIHNEQIPKDLVVQFKQIKEASTFEPGNYLSDRRLLIIKQSKEGKYTAVDETNTSLSICLNLTYIDKEDQLVLDKVIQIDGILPLTIHIHDIHIKDGYWYPKMIVLQPDFLIDITNISECFKPEGIIADTYLLRKLYSGPKTHHLLIGNIANFFLDEIIKQPQVQLSELMPKVFQLYPLDWIQYDDDLVRDIVKSIKLHFTHLKEVVNKDFKDINISLENIFLEPSFYSNKYGIQGRLDIYYRDNKKHEAKIIELKSGSSYRPNAYGLSSNHYAQTLLYDLLIKSVFDGVKPVNYILYSKLLSERLKFAPVLKDQQRKAMRIRNKIILREYELTHLQSLDNNGIISALDPKTFPIQNGFIIRDIKTYYGAIERGSDTDLAYYKAYVAFIAREQHLSKLGLPGRHKRRGISSLWLDSVAEKKIQYEIITGLKYQKTIITDDNPIIMMSRSAKNDQLANFRIGDITVLYPNNNGIKSVLSNQVFKCTILALNLSHVILRFRNSQLLLDYLVGENEWVLEHDILDSGYNHMYKSLHSFLSANESFRSLLYGNRIPIIGQKTNVEFEDDLSKDLSPLQLDIMKDMINSEEYYLLWGPPGTGKTSIMLRKIVEHLFHNTKERVLLLAYTNRAVDEICAAVTNAGLKDKYLRIGSRHASNSEYSDRLLNTHCKEQESRASLINLLKDNRIYISTVASIQGKSELLQSIAFDTVIIDEASQILEPNLVGLLRYFKRFILIGDHHQLPAVVRQSPENTSTSDPLLNKIGLNKLNSSLFERLIKITQSNGWNHAYGQLTHQGRMHQDIMQMASKMFYNSNLEIVNSISRLSSPILSRSNSKIKHVQILSSNRCIFVPTQKDKRSITGKTNEYEAKVIIKMIQYLIPIISQKEPAQNIGIITPYRAQIALINDILIKAKIPVDHITIDTVERYQGSARDIIFISLCTNSTNQLKMIGSDDNNQMNRKFNVALTRAKEQVIVVGNEEILSKDINYKYFISEATELSF